MANAFKETSYARLDRWIASSRRNLPTSVPDILSVWQTIKTTNLKWSERSWNIIDLSLKQNKRAWKQQLSNDLLVSRDMFIVNSCHLGYSKRSCWLIIFQRFNFLNKSDFLSRHSYFCWDSNLKHPWTTKTFVQYTWLGIAKCLVWPFTKKVDSELVLYNADIQGTQ